ncbi:MAG: hypothetical protein COA32_17480 [Fluviicola sp.]|nr:MAG: hypothetical protein COA32_17480 [Fluviicola sp.]
MKRIQLFEFEDQSWFPDWMRSSLTKLIEVLLRLTGLTEATTHLVKSKLKELNTQKLVDLGAGAGGVMIDVYQGLKKDDDLKNIQLILTDLYPNQSVIKKINDLEDPNLKYLSSPVDATQLAEVPEGLKTIFNAFHHLPKDKARAVLQSSVKSNSPILIYEMSRNNIPLLIWWLLLPISLVIIMVMVLFMTPFVKQLTVKQVLFTYVIPIIPIAYAWDGQASFPRTYALSDFDELLKGIDQSNYKFEIKLFKNVKGKTQGYYVFGRPLKENNNEK